MLERLDSNQSERAGNLPQTLEQIEKQMLFTNVKVDGGDEKALGTRRRNTETTLALEADGVVRFFVFVSSPGRLMS